MDITRNDRVISITSKDTALLFDTAHKLKARQSVMGIPMLALRDAYYGLGLYFPKCMYEDKDVGKDFKDVIRLVPFLLNHGIGVEIKDENGVLFTSRLHNDIVYDVWKLTEAIENTATRRLEIVRMLKDRL